MSMFLQEDVFLIFSVGVCREILSLGQYSPVHSQERRGGSALEGAGRRGASNCYFCSAETCGSAGSQMSVFVTFGPALGHPAAVFFWIRIPIFVLKPAKKYSLKTS